MPTYSLTEYADDGYISRTLDFTEQVTELRRAIYSYDATLQGHVEDLIAEGLLDEDHAHIDHTLEGWPEEALERFTNHYQRAACEEAGFEAAASVVAYLEPA